MKVLNIRKINPQTEKEIKHLIDSQDFEDFVQTIEDSLDEGLTFNELLSSKEILQKALKILDNDNSK